MGKKLGDGHSGMIQVKEKVRGFIRMEKNMAGGIIGIKVGRRKKKVYTAMVLSRENG